MGNEEREIFILNVVGIWKAVVDDRNLFFMRILNSFSNFLSIESGKATDSLQKGIDSESVPK